jgi:hypothetical protein
MTITTGPSPIGAQDTVVLADGPGVAFVPASAPLVGLNYFDGRFLRADDLNLERRGQRAYADLSNQACGSGVAWGFDLTAPDGATLALSAGLALAPPGALLHLPVAVTTTVRAVLEASGVAAPSGAPAGPAGSTAGFAPCTSAVTAPPTTSVVGRTGLFLVCLAPASGLCGQAEVLGRLCDDGCVTATDRPYVVDGVRLLLRPLDLALGPFVVAGVTTDAHLRSQVAAAYFAQEPGKDASLLAKAGLDSAVWSAGATAPGGDDVPIGVLGWNGSTITFLDTWTARRELVDPAPARYWARRVEQRPWSVFLAQVLQFQSQRTAPAPPVPSPAVPARILLERGFVELPPAGYLPVDPDRPDLRGQVQDLMGPGVALRLCAVPRDQVPRELERAQHLRRISLLRAAQGREPEPVDVLVPDGTIVTVPAARTGIGFAVDGRVGARLRSDEGNPLPVTGAARLGTEKAIDVRIAVIGAATQGMPGLVVALARQFLVSPADPDDLTRRRPQPVEPDVLLLRRLADAAFAASVRRRVGAAAITLPRLALQGAAAWAAATIDDDPFTLAVGARTRVSLQLDLSVTGDGGPNLAAQILDGRLERLPGGDRDATREVVVRLVGLLEVDLTSPSGLPDPEPPARGVDVTLVLHRGTQDGRTWFAVSDEDVTQVAVVSWVGSPTVAGVALATRVEAPPDLTPLVTALAAPDVFAALDELTQLARWRTLGALVARADPEVARPTDQHHEAAVSALIVLGAKTHPDELGYVADRNRQLFPPEDTAVTSEVRPSTDWVLFRRRTFRECEGGSVSPPKVSPVTVWIRTEVGADQATEVAGGVAQGQWPDDGWRRADVVFDPDEDTLLTPPQTWRERYRAAQGGPHIRLAVYAGTPDSPAALHVPGRLDALLAATAPAAVADVGATVGFAVDPPELILAGTEGSIFLVTYTIPDTPGPQLAVVGAEDANALFTALEGADVRSVTDASRGFARFGEFRAQDTDRDALQRALGGQLPPNPSSGRAVLWLDPSLPKADQVALTTLAEQARSVAEAVITPIALPLVATVTAAPPTGMPRAALFLLTVAQAG